MNVDPQRAGHVDHWVLWDIPAGVTSLPMNVGQGRRAAGSRWIKQVRRRRRFDLVRLPGPCLRGGTQSYLFA